MANVETLMEVEGLTTDKVKDGMDGDVLKENTKSTSQNIEYEREKMLTLKHRKDICPTNLPSTRSEGVKDLSLDDVIAERKILAPPKKRDRNREINWDEPLSEEINLGLNDIIKKRTISKNKEQDLGKSLDEIIKERKSSGNNEKAEPDNIDEESKGFEKKTNYGFGGRKRKLDADGEGDDDDDEIYYASPLDVIHRLSEDGLVIEQEVGKLKERAQGREHTWRATFACGTAKVVADACRKILAKEAAAYEFLKLLKETNACSHLKLPPFRIPEACFYDGVVCERLDEVIVNMGLEVPRFETVQTMKRHREYFKTTYFIGADEFVGGAFSMDHSKILAAKSAYETYSNKKFPRDTYIVGEAEDLGGIEPDEFKCIETEATHILTLDSVPTLREPPVVQAEDEEILVDTEGGIFVRAHDGSNKIRRLTRANLNEMLEHKLLEEVAKGIGSTAVVDEIDLEEEEELM